MSQSRHRFTCLCPLSRGDKRTRLRLRSLLRSFFLNLFWFLSFRCLLRSLFLRLLSSLRFRRLCLFRMLFYYFWCFFCSWTGRLWGIYINCIQRFSNTKSISLLNKEFSKDSCGWTFDLYSNFICLDIRDGLVQFYPVSLLFSKLSYSTLSDWVSNLWKREYFFLVIDCIPANI